MKRLIIASAMALTVVVPAMAQMPVMAGPPNELNQIRAELKTLADCTEAMRAMAADQAAELPPPAPLQADVVTIQQIILLVLQQMQGQQVETNRLLSAIAAPVSSRTTPQGASQ